MESPAKKLIQNTGYYTMALVVQKIISFVYFSYLATQIGAENTAKYFFAISFVTIFSVFIDLGLVSLLNREIAKNKESHQKLLSNVIGIKLLSSLLVILAILIITKLLNYNIYLEKMIYLSIITMIIDTFTLTFFAVVRGNHNLKYESISSIIFQIIVISIGYLMLQKTQEPFLLLLVLLIASAFNLIYSALILNFKYKLKIVPQFNKEFIKLLLITTWPFAIATIFLRISGSIDSVFLSKMVSEKALGYYGLAYKITFAFQFIPMAFAASLYPAFTHFYNYEKEKLEKIFNKSLIYLLMLSLPIITGIIILANQIIIKIYGVEFFGSILTLQILICNLPFVFLTFPLGSLLNACNRQKIHTKNIIITMLASIIANLALIPIFSQNGAALASIIASLVYLILNTISAHKIIKFYTKEILVYALKITAACLLMAFVVISLKNKINIGLVMLSGAAVYPISLILFQALKKEDLLFIKQIFKK
ncbi:flippase [bacterium]|nr:flippase [bacterium]